ncbi:MAG TPA: chromosome segregation protein SMC [candidate division WOR-3 bacterium]|uniref:Chromosome partition protein Smc n=1 Tax=candidate division WOR-3 bacterium TaxID=2052148 RepID=A0A7V0T748_UNCW3|nr:chromosome segregation protein SMC [candidate division WOR-3 bacterium]
MHISELELVGFKSFQDKTTLRFSPRMNAIIGPNGCGKTNILDALRWVLGEQSTNVLRCERNEDLIFGGTAKIAPTNLAEVRMVLANDSLPEYPSEIEIRRRYFRSGESEYYLNRQACRMKDINEVFLRSGIGTRVYSIFDLRQMREVIAGNVRKLFEEAATLVKYREAKADCRRKLDLTESDLLRLDDILAERERVVRSLRRQSGRLRAWEKLRAVERDLRLLELKDEYETLARALEAADRDVESLEAAGAERSGDIHRLERELAGRREQVRAVQGRKDAITSEARRVGSRLSELESRDLVAAQRIIFLEEDATRAETEREALAGGIADLETAFTRVLRELERADARRQERQAELAQARLETAAAERKLHELRSHGQTVRESFQQLLEKRHEARGRVDYLEAMDRNEAESEERQARELEETRARLAQLRADREAAGRAAEEAEARLVRARAAVAELETALGGAEAGADENLAARNLARDRRARLEKELAVLRSLVPDLVRVSRELLGERVRGETGGLLDIEPGWERAAEAALQPVLAYLVVEGVPGPDDLRALAERGPETGCGLVRPDDTAPPPLPDPPGSRPDGVAGPLAERVRPRAGCPAVVARLIGAALIVEDDADLEELARRLPGRTLVNSRGCARLDDGSYLVAGPARGRLRLERGLEETEAALGTAEAEQARLEAQARELESRSVELDRRLEAARAELTGAERAGAAGAARRDTLAAREDEIARDETRLRDELARVRARRRDGAQALAAAKEELAGLDARVEKQTEVQRRVDDEVGTQENEARERLAAAGERLSGLSDERQQVSRFESERDFLRRSIEERRRQVAALADRAAQARAEAARLAAERDATQPEVTAAREEIAGLETRISELSVAELVRSEEELEGNLAELRTAQEQHQKLLLEQRMARHELAGRRKALVEEAANEYGTDLANFRPAAENNVAGRLDEIRRRLAALGQVNPLALEEYEQERSDCDRLSAQRADVIAARDNLLQSMAEIDRHARERFVETYALVREQFRDVFRRMFLAGEADLELADAQNPLESEITITARPRGKTPKRLEQLSDGEKALLAVSLLFAFYRVKPAPFCFMDEIDAPLDDANVGRFADYLKQMSARTQVIIITHNRLTVERADSLFGVTSEQPGVSKLVSVNLADYRESAVGAAVS